ncbi:FAD-binding monooxygenase [Tardiphaga sp. 768_D3_N2_1]|uniref:FAD-binding monooxygenase n=1 Tax=Tardiphaga sp. 768_D3_N2_1 TaxID=3240783 RepID=UPI003F887F46
MQFHLNGFAPGDPEIADPTMRHPAPGASGALPDQVDVLIIGCGPAGLTLAAQLSAFPDIKTCIIDQKPGPLLRGQADGIACRTMEMFEAFGFSERVLKEACWINETTFWTPDEKLPANIVRSGRVQDTEDGLSEFPHVVLNQARVHDFYLDVMRKSPAALEPHYARRLLGLDIAPSVARDDAHPHRVTARIERLDPTHGNQIETIKARYVVGCDGARSTVRSSIGRTLVGDSANHAWGVMDVLAVTDFPDIRFKSLIRSATGGSMIIIPREGGYLFRLYIEMDKLDVGERVANRNITPDHLVAAAQRIFNPYRFDVKEISWWSVYEIGQRLCDKFDDVQELDTRSEPCVFIAGDACHTHSPKAGQGMNVSMQDGFNLGWKLASVLRKTCAPALLHSYSAERQAIAKELIDFDREWAQVLSSASKSTANGSTPKNDQAETQDYFVKHGRYTAGTAVLYRPSPITGESTYQHLAAGLTIGMRFHSAPVIRVTDAKPLHLGHTIKADGRWRLFAFAGSQDPASPKSGIHSLCEFLTEAEQSPIRKYTSADDDIDSVIDVRAIFQQSHDELAINVMPPLLLPKKGRFGLVDYEKIFCSDTRSDIFTLRNIDRKHGCVVIVRPDQYVAHVLPLDGYKSLAAFFDGFLIQR